MEVTKNCLMQIATKILTDYISNFVYSYKNFYRLLRIQSRMTIMWNYSDSLRVGRAKDRTPVWGEIFRTRTERPWGPPSLLYNGYRDFFTGGKAVGVWR